MDQTDYWAKLDLEWWRKEGFRAHMEKIRNFPWEPLEDQMQWRKAYQSTSPEGAEFKWGLKLEQMPSRFHLLMKYSKHKNVVLTSSVKMSA